MQFSTSSSDAILVAAPRTRMSVLNHIWKLGTMEKDTILAWTVVPAQQFSWSTLVTTYSTLGGNNVEYGLKPQKEYLYSTATRCASGSYYDKSAFCEYIKASFTYIQNSTSIEVNL